MNRRTRVIRAKLSHATEFVGGVHRYWEWHIPNPVGREGL